MELLKVDSIDEAIEKLYNKYLEANKELTVEEVKVSSSLDRILAEDVKAGIDVPEFDRSVVDGFAVCATDTEGANDTIPTFLNVVGESAMGEECTLEIKSGECVYVPTGAMIPKGATACVMVEHTENITNDKIAVYESVGEGKNIIKRGDDIKKETICLKKGKKITPSDMGFLSSIGIDSVKVFKNWNITVVSTGDELVDSNDNYKYGKIRDINTNLIVGLSNKYKFNVLNTYLLKDNEDVLKEAIKNAMTNSDVIIVSGGSSKGKKDATSIVIDSLTSSKVISHGIAVKPGKPTITGFDKPTNTIIIGLPGNPVASAIIFKLLVVGLYKRITFDSSENLFCEGIMSENIPASPGRMTFQLVKLDSDLNVTPIYGRSGLIHTLSDADGYIIIDINDEGKNKGDKVKVYYF